MPNVTRRAFIGGAAAIPFAIWLEKYGWAQAAAPRIRYDARSTQGQAMLKLYAKAVGNMMSNPPTPVGDPRSWTFQWYTHWVNGATTKTAELARIYPSPSPWRNLAQEMWSTCQAHGPGEDENFFLPWHRMFVYFFESIVRAKSGNNTFTLPYWNYSTSVASARGVMPPEFRMQSDPLLKSLYVSNRNPGVNTGKPIQQGRPDDPLSLSALKQCTYSPVGRAVPGFCQDLDFGLHGNIHVMVGDSKNMGQVPYAAKDPIFWMHHCNIDRLWASWNAGGRKNPTDAAFLAKTFVFADANGSRVVAKVQDFLDIAKLGYKYDKLEPVPACPPPSLAAAAATTHVTAKAPIPLGSSPVRASLEPPAGTAAAAASVLPNRVRALPASRRLYLVIRDLQTDAQPGVLYHVYLELPASAAANQTEQYHVGTINFFAAMGHDHAAAAAGTPRFYSFDITDLAKKLQSKNQLSAKPTVTIAPDGQPAADAKPVVGEISVVEQ
jgi:tyrosinase